jgi:hypothetical protein
MSLGSSYEQTDLFKNFFFGFGFQEEDKDHASVSLSLYGHKDGGPIVAFQGKERGNTTIIEGGKMKNVMIMMMMSFELIYSSLTFIGEVYDSIQRESNC